MLNWNLLKSRIASSRSDYNSTPEGLTEINEAMFMKNIFHYCFGEMQSRQVCDGNTFNLRMFPLAYEDWNDLGFAIIDDWIDHNTRKNRPESIYRFARYGNEDRWETFIANFISQFQK